MSAEKIVFGQVMLKIKKPTGTIEYTIFVQRGALMTAAISFLLSVLTMIFLDPTESILYIYIFLFFGFLELTSILSLIAFWWVFSIKKNILTVYQVNQLIGQSAVTASVAITFVVMHQTGTLSFLTGSVVLLCYLLYQLWIGSNQR